MKRCPTCNQTFADANLTFCINDGTPLVTIDEPSDFVADESTVVRPSSSESPSGSPSSSRASNESSNAPAYQPPGSYIPRDYAGQQGQPGKRKAWLWIVGMLVLALLVFGGLGIAAALLVPQIMRASKSTNSNSATPNENTWRTNNSNLSSSNSNSNSDVANSNENDNADAEDTTPAPTDEAEVLATLTDLEHEWTVANINADKKKLNRILADDYVSTLPDGRQQGKAEYLKTATRDTTIQKWNFEDLKATLRGDRATLNGIIRLEVRNARGQEGTASYTFIDKFVWRDGRWQATGSEVKPLLNTDQ